MGGFTFYQEYYETLCKMKKTSDRQAVLSAMLEFVFDDKEPQGLSEVAEIVFEMFRKNLTKSRNKSKNARNKPKSNENQTEIKSETNQNQIKTNEIKSNQNLERDIPLKENSLKEKESTKEKRNIYPKESYPLEKGTAQARACEERDTGYNGMEFFNRMTERIQAGGGIANDS